jgi:hypothetical protein
MSVQKYFKDRAQKKEENKLFRARLKELIDAIRLNDDKAVSTLFEQVKSSPLYTSSPTIDLPSSYTADVLLREAINTDNLKIFSIIFGAQGNRNCWLGRTDRTINHHYKENILHAALNAGSRSIALALAANEAVDIRHSGGSFYTSRVTGEKFDQVTFPSPLKLAEEKGLKEIAATLSERMAEEHLSSARRLRSDNPAQLGLKL